MKRTEVVGAIFRREIMEELRIDIEVRESAGISDDPVSPAKALLDPVRVPPGSTRSSRMHLIAALTGKASDPPEPADTQVSAARARKIVMEVERSLGFDPVDREFDKLGCYI